MVIETRHRDKTGEISHKHGNTLIRTLRKHYGAGFAKGGHDNEKLGDVLQKLDEPSLTKLLRDHEVGGLEQICRASLLMGWPGRAPAPEDVESGGESAQRSTSHVTSANAIRGHNNRHRYRQEYIPSGRL